MCIWYRGWYFEACSCIIWDKSWSCGYSCRIPRRKLLRQFLGICPNCSIMNNISSNPESNPSNRKTENIHEQEKPDCNSVPCDAQYDPSDVFDEALDEHIKYHPWNIMMANSWAAAGGLSEIAQSSVWGPSLNYDTLLRKYTETSQQKSEQQQHNLPAGTRAGPQSNEEQLETKHHPLSDNKTNPAAYGEGDGGYESDEDPVPPEYRYKS